MDKNSFVELCKTYKKLLFLEIMDISLFFDKCKDTCRKVVYRFEDGKVEFIPIDKELEEVLYKLQRAGQSFRGYKMDSNKLVRNYSTMMEWIGRIKKTKRLQNPLDIQNAILEEMSRQEKEKGLVLESPGARGEDKTALLSVETTLFYRQATGKFSFNGKESLSIFKSPKAKVGGMAKKLMKWWEKGRPCPMNEFVQDPTKKTPQWAYNDTSKIRCTLQTISVNMPQAAAEGYPPPGEPQNFRTRIEVDTQ